VHDQGGGGSDGSEEEEESGGGSDGEVAASDDGGDDNDSDEDTDQNLRKFNSQMKNLAKQDPEFFQYLQANDKQLLAAADDEDEEEEEGGEEEEEEEEDEGDEAGEDGLEDDDGTAVRSGEIITPELFDSMQAAASSGGKNLKALRALVHAFAAAFQQETRGGAIKSPYVITSGVVFQKVVSLCIGSMGHMFDVYFDIKPVPGSSSSTNTRPTASAQWRRGRAVVKTYLSALIHALTDAPDPSMCHHLLRHCQALLPYFAPFPRLSRQLLKQALSAWGQKEKVGVQAFLVIRSLALSCPFPFIELTFKGCYISFGRHTGIAPASTQQRQQQEFLAQCVVELYSLDAAAAYEHAFVYLRELAVQMRQGIASKTSAAVSEVTSWSFLNRFSLWGRAICAMPSKAGGLGDLVYPYVQMAMALLKFVQGARLAPLRLHIIRACLRVSQHSGVYVPLAPPLLEMFRFPEVSKSSNVTGTAVNMECSIKISATALRTRAACDSIVTAALAMLHKFCCLHATSVAFPELMLPLHKVLHDYRTPDQFAPCLKR
jgi:nucleolar complex protein 2